MDSPITAKLTGLLFISVPLVLVNVAVDTFAAITVVVLAVLSVRVISPAYGPAALYAMVRLSPLKSAFPDALAALNVIPDEFAAVTPWQRRISVMIMSCAERACCIDRKNWSFVSTELAAAVNAPPIATSNRAVIDMLISISISVKPRLAVRGNICRIVDRVLMEPPDNWRC